MIPLHNLQDRLRNRYRRMLVYHFARKSFLKTASTAYISFSFDDFPRSAFLTGASVLEKHGVHGTFFVCMGLLNTETLVGRIATLEDLHHLVTDGHELGCHTFDHPDGCLTSSKVFERSVIENQHAFKNIFPSGHLRVFAYPLNGPRLKTKLTIGKRFLCCRGGGQTFNSNNIDLNLLKACFLDWRNRDDLISVRKLIDENNVSGGWLIFATHDVTTEPSQYGCKPDFFNKVVRYATESGACILPVASTCYELGIDTN